MDQSLVDYIQKKRDQSFADETIKRNLVDHGWDATMVDVALQAGENDAPLAPTSHSAHKTSKQPVAVVQAFTTRGLEYSIMFISLWVSATAIGFLLHSMIDTGLGTENTLSETIPFASSALIVAFPIFALLFLRLKRAELKDPHIKLDPSRKKSIQLTLLVTFIIGLFHIIGYVYSLLNGSFAVSGQDASPFVSLLHTLVTLGIAGGIFAYYWHDQHQEIE